MKVSTITYWRMINTGEFFSKDTEGASFELPIQNETLRLGDRVLTQLWKVF